MFGGFGTNPNTTRTTGYRQNHPTQNATTPVQFALGGCARAFGSTSTSIGTRFGAFGQQQQQHIDGIPGSSASGRDPAPGGFGMDPQRFLLFLLDAPNDSIGSEFFIHAKFYAFSLAGNLLDASPPREHSTSIAVFWTQSRTFPHVRDHSLPSSLSNCTPYSILKWVFGRTIEGHRRWIPL